MTALISIGLVDGAVCGEVVDCADLLAQPTALGLYDDLGDEAARCGPILIHGPSLDRFEPRAETPRDVSLEGPALCGGAAVQEMVLTDGAVERMMEAVWPWSLLAAVEESDHAVAAAKDDARNVVRCRVAADWARARRCSFPIEIAYASGLIRSRDAAMNDPEFSALFEEAARSGQPTDAARWIEARYPEPLGAE